MRITIEKDKKKGWVVRNGGSLTHSFSTKAEATIYKKGYDDCLNHLVWLTGKRLSEYRKALAP